MVVLVDDGGNEYDRANDERGNLLCTCEWLPDELTETGRDGREHPGEDTNTQY